MGLFAQVGSGRYLPTSKLGSLIKVVHISPFYVCFTMLGFNCRFIIGLFQTDSTDQNCVRPATEAASKTHLQHHTKSLLLTGFRTEMKSCMRILRTENKRSSSIADVM